GNSFILLFLQQKLFTMETDYAPAHSEIYNWMYNNLLNLGLTEQTTHTVNAVILFLLLVAVLYALDFLLRRILLITLIRVVSKTRTLFDDYLLKNKVLKYFMHIVSIAIVKQF